ncbi:MAG: hypothetical protein IT442_12475 [Phycisphaeraceae bacterium]|nr:hypothetical protein [Phycisphaeraceae bacterium]
MPAPTGCLSAGVYAWSQLFPTINVELRDVVMTLANYPANEYGIDNGEYRFNGSVACTPQLSNGSLTYLGMTYGGMTHTLNGVETQRDARAIFYPGCATVDGSLCLWVYGLFLMIPYQYQGYDLGFEVFRGIYRWNANYNYAMQPCMFYDNHVNYNYSWQRTGSGRGWIDP